MSKGDKRRPKFISDEQLESNWELAFGKPQKDRQKNAKPTKVHKDKTKYSRKTKHKQ